MKRNEKATGRKGASSQALVGQDSFDCGGKRGVGRRSELARQGDRKAENFVDVVRRLIDECGLHLHDAEPVQGGTQLIFWEGATATHCHKSGLVVLRGKTPDVAAEFAEELRNYIKMNNHAIQMRNLSELFADE
jgi:hypothetical protein